MAALVSRGAVDPVHKHLVAVGLLGALTTFSTFGVETVQLLEQGHAGKAAGSVLANVALALAAAWCGLRIESLRRSRASDEGPRTRIGVTRGRSGIARTGSAGSTP